MNRSEPDVQPRSALQLVERVPFFDQVRFEAAEAYVLDEHGEYLLRRRSPKAS